MLKLITTFFLFTICIPSILCAADETVTERAVLPQVIPPGAGINIDPCSLRGDPQPEVTRWFPGGRSWPGGRIVFEGQHLDASRFEAVVGSPRITLKLVSATPTRIEMQVPSLPEGGPYSLPTGERLVVSYKGTVGCRVLNPTFIVTDPFTLTTTPGRTASGANNFEPNGGYFWIRHQINFVGEIEGIRTITILKQTDPAAHVLVPDFRAVCDWNALLGPTIVLKDNHINHSTFGFFRDDRRPPTPQDVKCVLPVSVTIVDIFTNTSQQQLFMMPMTLHAPRTVFVDSYPVIRSFHGVQPDLLPQGGPVGNCGTLVIDQFRPTEGTVGVRIQDQDWVFSIKSGVTPTKCSFNSTPIDANLGVAFGPGIDWRVTNSGNPSRCRADTSGGGGGIRHRLDSVNVTLYCDPGPLGDNGVTIRASSVSLLVPHEYIPRAPSLEVPQ